MLNERAQSPKTRTFLLFFLPALFVFLLFPGQFFSLPYDGVDGSWCVALHLAIKYHLLFGKDFSFTYGPLAVLRLRYPIVVSKYVYLLSDLYFIYIGFTGFFVFIRHRLRPGIMLFFFFSLLIALSMELEKWYMFLMLLFLIEYCRQPGKRIYLVHAASLSLICFYIKVNTGLINFFMLFLVIHYALLVKKMTWKTYLMFVLAFLAALFLSARLLHTDLVGYIQCSDYLIKDYEDVMYLPLSGRLAAVTPWGAGALWILLAAIYVFVLIKALAARRLPAELETTLIYILVAIVMFVWYKNGFIRADGHVYQFFNTAAIFAVFLYAYTPESLGKRIVAFLCWALLVVDIVTLLLLPESGFPGTVEKIARLSLITDKVRDIPTYIRGFREYDDQMIRTDSLTSLPNPFKEVIGNHTADIIPTEISILYANGIRYAPRPVIQSYSAYDKFLDGLNADRYLSPKAPDYVLFSLDGTEDRFAWMDESRTKLALAARYRPVRMVKDQLLLQKEESPRQMTKTKEDTVHTRMGVEIPVEKGNGLLYTRIQVKKNFAGKFRSFVYQPPELQMIYTLMDGEVRYFRVLQPLLEDGMILNKYVNSTPEFRLFLLSDGRLNEDVRSIRIQPNGQGGYQDDITMINTWYMPADKSEARRRADSVGLLQLTGNNIPLKPLVLTPSRCTDSMRYSLEYVRDHAGLIRIAGWAMHPDRDNKANLVKVLAISTGVVYELPSSKYDLPSVPYDLFSRKDISGCGFVSMISRTQLPPGNYQIGLVIYDTATGGSCLHYIDSYFDIPRPLHLERVSGTSVGAQNSAELKYNIDDIREVKDSLLVQGWALIPSFPGLTATNLILLNDTAAYRVSTNLKRREDIMAAVKDSGFEYSGFSVALPVMEGPSGIFRIGIEKASLRGVVRGRVMTDNTVRLGLAYKTVPVGIDSLPPEGRILGNIDQLEEQPDVVTISGWALGDTLHAFHGQKELILKGAGHLYRVPLERVSRPDIVGHFNNKSLADCGFSVHFAKDAMVPGTYVVGICLRPDGAAAAVKFFNQTIKTQ